MALEALTKALAFVERYRLAAHDRQIAAFLIALRADEGAALDPAVINAFIARVDRFAKFHEHYSWITPPPDVLQGPIIIGDLPTTKRPVGLTLTDITKHGLLVGSSGFGKTSALIRIVRSLIDQGIHLRIWDFKNDFDWLLADPRVLILDETTKLAALRAPGWLPLDTFKQEITDLWLAAMYGAAHQREVITNAWNTAAERDPVATFADLRTAINTTRPSKETFQQLDARRNTTARTDRLQPYALFATHDGLSWDDFQKKSVILRTQGVDDVPRFLWSVLARMTYLHNRTHQVRDTLTHVIVNDEAYDVVGKNYDGITSNPLLADKQRWREFGIGSISTTVSLKALDDLARASTFWTLTFGASNQAEAREIISVLGLTPTQAEEFKKISVGQALLRVGNWPEVVHLTIPPHNEQKTVSPAVIAAARERTNALARSIASLPPNTIAAREAMVSHPAPSRSSAPSPPPTVAAVVEQAPPKKARKPERQGKLTAIEQRLVDYIAANGVVLTTECQHDLKLHPQQVARAKAKLLALTLVTSETIRCRAGRGGSGVAVALTPAGVALATAKPLRTTRGNDSVQHQFLATRIAKAITSAQLELSLNGKSIDVVIAYDKSAHAQLIKTLAPSIALNDGDLLAIEVEVSNPAKTLASNVRKNTTVGIAYNIIAVLPNTLASAKKIAKTLDASLRARVTVVDALDLLNRLQEQS